jgi:hypothetical protein
VFKRVRAQPRFRCDGYQRSSPGRAARVHEPDWIPRYYKVSSSPQRVEVLALWHASRGAAPPL